MIELILVRHTRVSASPGICYGRSDLSLAPTFEQEAAGLTAHLKGMHTGPFIVYSSPSQRCLQLARRLNYGPVHVLKGLREMDFGLWEMRAWEEIGPLPLDAWARAPLDFRIPGGDSARLVRARALRACCAVLRDLRLKQVHEPAATALAVSHAGPIRLVLGHLLNLPISKTLDIIIGYGTVVRIRWPGLSLGSISEKSLIYPQGDRIPEAAAWDLISPEVNIVDNQNCISSGIHSNP